VGAVIAIVALAAALAATIPAPFTPGADLTRAYAGVACRTPNGIACDRVGLAVAIRPRPRAVVARLGQRSVALHANDRGGPWIGYLDRAGLAERLGRTAADGRWAGADAPLVGAAVTATFADGHRETLPLLTPLRAGFG
jgi:hypothetical protein